MTMKEQIIEIFGCIFVVLFYPTLIGIMIYLCFINDAIHGRDVYGCVLGTRAELRLNNGNQSGILVNKDGSVCTY